ncbi:hypothetical protein SAMN05892883_2803 [Jatrophihabitans sp. GAS493]|uniref:NYN domain-containing protein n=1 Tax=Jatrophihabitans sp. GAS493 TaxID=1907575 RepID=UPI000BC09F03|nr:NYN domain-containing protein [Jatrophihabitans sp. GAS493]SOD73510.1 hypothetical protein SAMN05892883_2803 [Jatrophihabitans sp. GAS493]
MLTPHICEPAGTPAASHRCTCPRALHLIDLENLLGDRARRDEASITDIWSRYWANVPIGRDDLLVVATGPSLAATAWFALPRTVRRLVGYGINGADHALLDALDPDHAAARFGRVVIGSGDHIFAPTLYGLRLRGVDGWQVTGRGHPSTALASAATHRIDLFGRPAVVAAVA